MSETSSQDATLPRYEICEVQTSELSADTQKSSEENEILKQSASLHDDITRKISETEISDLSIDTLKSTEEDEIPKQSASLHDDDINRKISGTETSDLSIDTQKSSEEDEIPKQSASFHGGNHVRKSSETEIYDLSTDTQKSLEKHKTPDNDEVARSNNKKDLATSQLASPLNNDLFSKHSLNNNENDNEILEDLTSSSNVESLVIDLPDKSNNTITSQDKPLNNTDQLFNDAHNNLLQQTKNPSMCADDNSLSVLVFDKENTTSCKTSHDISLKVVSDFRENTAKSDKITGIYRSFDSNIEKINDPLNNQNSKNTSMSSSDMNDHSDVEDMDDSNLLHIDLSSKEDEIGSEEKENTTAKDIQEPSNTKVSEEKEECVESGLITGSDLIVELDSEKNISEVNLPNTLKDKTTSPSSFYKMKDIPFADIDSSDTESIESANANTIIPSAIDCNSTCPNSTGSNAFQPVILNVVGNCNMTDGQIEPEQLLPFNAHSVTQNVFTQKRLLKVSELIQKTSEAVEKTTSASSTAHAPKTMSVSDLQNKGMTSLLTSLVKLGTTNPSTKASLIAPKPPIAMYYQNGLINKVQSKEASGSPTVPVIATGIASSSRPTLIIQAGSGNVSAIRSLAQLQSQTTSLINKQVLKQGQLSLLSSSIPGIQTSQVQNGTIIKQNGQTYSVTFNKDKKLQNIVLKHKEDQLKKKTEPILGGNLRDKLHKITEEVRATSALDREDLIKSDFFCTGIFNNALHSNNDNCLYECSACKDKFNHLAGLEYHLFRCVFMLEYHCSVCSKKLTFFNKCRFWRHIVAETGDPLEAKKRFITEKTSILMLPLPSKHIAIAAQENHLDKLLNEELNEKLCPCCLESFVSVTRFQMHLQKGDGKNSFQCPHCKLVMKSKCAATAHRKIHSFSQSQTSEQDFWCPECGDTDLEYIKGKSNGNNLGPIFEHLDKCFHFNRAHAFKCLDPSCSETFISEGTFKSHLLSKHMYVLFKCKVCSTAYKDDFTQLVKHYLSQHKVDMSKSSFQPIKFCILCKVVSNSVEDLMQHLNKHFVEMAKKWIPKYKCFACLQCFNKQSDLNKHLETFHNPKPKRCTMCLSLFSSRKLLVEHILQKKCKMSLSKQLDVCVDIKEPDSYHDVLTKVKALFTPRVLPVSNSRVVFANHITNPSYSANNTRIQPSVRIGSPNFSIQNRRPVVINMGNQSNIRFSSRPALPILAPAPSNTQSLIRPSVATTIQMNASRISSSLLQGVNAGSECTDRNSPNGALSGRKRKADSIDSDDSSDKEPFQCHSCKIVIQGSRNWFEHTNEHYLEGRTIIREKTRCIVCNKYVITDILEKHIKEHQNKGIKVCKLCQCRSFETLRQVREHEKALCRYTVVEGNGCPFPTDTDNETEDIDAEDLNEELDVESDRRESTESNGIDNQDESDVESSLIDMESVLVPCLLCGITFSNKKAQQDHMSRMHDGTRNVFFCLLCYRRTKEKKVFKKRQLLVRHIELKHKLTSESEIEKLIKEEEQSITSGREVTATAPGQEEEDQAPPKRLRIEAQGDFLCGKCAFSCTDQEKFSKHIASHNSKKDPQCPECGLCFTVASAMKKHLFAVHKIKAIDNYLKSKGLLESESEDEEELPCRSVPVFPPSPEVGSGRRGDSKAFVGRKKRRDKSPEFVDPGECNVCYRVFDDEATLRTHMRNHGMAFIRSKRHKTGSE